MVDERLDRANKRQSENNGKTPSRREVLQSTAVVTASGILNNVIDFFSNLLDGIFGSGSSQSNRVSEENSVRWTAIHQSLEAYGASDEEGKIPRRSREGVLSTNTMLKYVGVDWDEYGNPDPNAENQGSWQHTFLLVSYAFGLKPFAKYLNPTGFPPKLYPRGTDWVPADTHTSGTVSGFFDEMELLLVNRNLKNQTVGPDRELDRNYSFIIDIGSQLEIAAATANANKIAISARRDKDLYGFVNSSALANSLGGSDRTQTEKERMLDFLNDHTYIQSDPAFSEAKKLPTANVTKIKQQLKKKKERSGVVMSGLLELMGIGATIGGLAFTGSVITVVGVVLLVVNGLKAIAPPKPKIPYFNGFANGQSKTGPLVSHYVMFDVYVSPSQSGYFTVRNNHPADIPAGFGKSNPGEQAVWTVKIGKTPSGPEDATPGKKHSAQIVPPTMAIDSYIGVPNYPREISVSGTEDLATFRPTADFNMRVDDADSGTQDGEITVPQGTTVTFDSTPTQLGGSYIKSHDWAVERLDPTTEGVEPWDQVKTHFGEPGNIFATQEAGVWSHIFEESGSYKITLRVHDAEIEKEEDEAKTRKSDTVEKHLQVVRSETQNEDTNPIISSVTTNKDTVQVGESVTTTVEADPVKQPENRFRGPDGEEVSQLIYRWGISLASEELPEQVRDVSRADRMPPLTIHRAYDNQLFKHSFSRPLTYEIWVRVTDLYYGGSTVENTTVSVEPADGTTNQPSMSFDDDFDYPTSELEDQGWTITSGDFSTKDSKLIAGDESNKQRIYHKQGLAAGEFIFEGVQNTTQFYGLKIQFIADADLREDAIGYELLIAQGREGSRSHWNDIRFVRRDPDGGEVLLTLTNQHDGTSHDIRIMRDPETYEFTCYLDGEQVGTVEDDTYTESQSMILVYDTGGNHHSVNRISVRSSESV